MYPQKALFLLFTSHKSVICKMEEDFTEFRYLSALISPKPIEAEPPSSYRYEALSSLGSIRLVQILPGEPTADIQVNIEQTIIEDASRYEAISYTWGNKSDPQQIFCGPGRQRLSVMENCVSILRRLRQPDEPRLVWVDAICIDQSSVPERNAQVAIMGRIYEKASRVIIDIGDASRKSDFALDALMHCAEDKLYPMELGLDIRDAVGELYRRPWFGRVWVLQEAFRAKEAAVICGKRFVPWKYFRPFQIWVDSRQAHETEPWHVELPSIIPYALAVGNHQSRTYDARKDLLNVLCKGRECDATDPRDKFFALLPMFQQEEDLKADYSKSQEQVYIELAGWLLSNFGLSFLSCVHEHWEIKSTLRNFPSWVPDWSLPIREKWLLGVGGVYYPLSAAGNTSSIAEVLLPPSESMPTLKVRGILVDTIRTTSGDLNFRTAIMPSPSVAEFLDESHRYRISHPEGPVALPKARHWRPKTAERRLHPPDWMAYDYGLPLERPMDFTDNEMADLITYFCSGTGRSLASTERGYFGLVPDRAQPADVVCCLLGSGVPFVLREVKTSRRGERKYFTLVGEAYIYGLMDGEALAKVDLAEAAERVALSPLEDIYIR